MTPLIKGGQGRTRRDIEGAMYAVLMVVGLGAVFVTLWEIFR